MNSREVEVIQRTFEAQDKRISGLLEILQDQAKDADAFNHELRAVIAALGAAVRANPEASATLDVWLNAFEKNDAIPKANGLLAMLKSTE